VGVAHLNLLLIWPVKDFENRFKLTLKSYKTTKAAQFFHQQPSTINSHAAIYHIRDVHV